MADNIWQWDATRMAEAIARREISSREAVEACLGRMAVVNPRLNAVTVDLGEEAREAADRADAAVARGDALGPLHGVPISIKENVDQAGCATTNGVVAFREVIAREDSPVVANLKAAGAVIIGRTNTPAFSFRLDTENELRGRTVSPWSERHTPRGGERRGRLVGGGGHHPDRARQRHRRVGSLPGLLLRPRGPAAVLRPRPGVQPERHGRALDVMGINRAMGLSPRPPIEFAR